jgi:single-stranded DNA-binding protein
MGRFNATFDGAVVAEPESFEAGNSTGLKFPVYVNEQRKNRDTDKYEDTGNVSKIQVTLWNDQINGVDVRKGDIVEVDASLHEREYEGKNGKGRSLETQFVNSVVVKWRKEGEPVAAGGFASGGPEETPW